MSSFTDEFFKNSKNTKSSTTTTNKKKKKELDVDNFTSSFFENYSDDEDTKSSLSNYDDSFIEEYNTFLDELNVVRQDYFTKQAEREAKKANEVTEAYYEQNKDSLKKERSEKLIYNWNLQDSGGVTYNYGSMPIQDKNGYLKKTDSDGNVYWVDVKKDLLYDSNYKLINDDRLKNKDFIDSLKYEYDKNSKSNINTSALSNSDKLGLIEITKDKYQYLIDDENKKIKEQSDLWESRQDYFRNSSTAPKLPDHNYINEHSKEGWIIQNGKYYKPMNQTPLDKKGTININGKFYTEITDEKPKTYFDQHSAVKNPYENAKNVYEVEFDKLNEAIEKGNFTTANNALQTINKKYFGHEYSDGWWSAIWNSNSNDLGFFQKKFADNVDRLNVINDSIANTSDATVLEELRAEKNKLELENTLIQYNRLCSIHSDQNLINKMDSISDPVDEAWDKVGTLWSDTFDDWDDGADFTDIFGTAKNILNNSFQTIGTLGKNVNASFQMIETLAVSDMDDGAFKDTWAPAIMDIATYLIPYVGQARMIINYAEPASVISSAVLREGSATIATDDGEIKKADMLNAIGASINIGANYFSDAIFSKIRGRFSGEVVENWYKNSGRAIFTTMFKEGLGEGMEEFVQTYAEIMQNTDEDISLSFFKDHFSEALESAMIAFVLSSGASGSSIGVNAIRGSKGNIEVSGDAVDNIRINKDLSEKPKTNVYSSSTTKKYEDITYDSMNNSEVNIQNDNDAITDIATQLNNGNIITMLDSDSVKTDSKQNINIDLDSGKTNIANAVINDNIKTVLVPSKEMETFLKSIRDDLTIYTVDPKSETFMNDVREYVTETSKSNLVTKNISDFVPNNYVFTPNEVTEINNMINEYTNKANLLDSVNNPNEFKLQPQTISISDITDSSLETIMNTIKTKFLNDIDSNRYSKETAVKEFKSLSNKLSDYVLKSNQKRTYIKDAKNNIITFAKRGANLYEAVTTVPRKIAETEILTNVKTTGNIINGNLNQKISFAKKQLNAVNTLIDKLKLKGNYLTNDSTYKDIAGLVKTNKEFSGEILQALGADGLIEGKNKVRLYTAYNDLDNANPSGAIKNTIKQLDESISSGEITKKASTEAPKIVNKKIEPSKVSSINTEISTEDVAYNPEDTSDINSVDAEKFIDELFANIKITDKKTKADVNELKTKVRKLLFDRYVHINDIAKTNNDYNVRAAISELEAVANDAQQMIDGAQVKDNKVIGNSLNKIYKPLKGKKERELFEKYMLFELNIERENAGVDKIFEKVTKEQSRKAADLLLKKHPKFKHVAKELQKYNNNLLDMLVDGGVITEQMSNKLKNRYKYYMPIYSSELSTFADIDSNKYFKNMKVDDTIQDVTKTGTKIQTLKKSLENKTYNVLSAIAKNKLATEMALSGKYESKGDGDLIFYQDGKITKMKTSQDIIRDINDNTLSHIADQIAQYPVLKQLVGASNLSYKFILDPIYQVKNVVIDFTDSQLIYSKDKKNFAKNYVRAAIAMAKNSEVFNEFKELGLAEVGTGWRAPTVTTDSEGNIHIKQNKFQRVFANLEAMPKMAEYLSLKDKYMKQAKKDYDSGKYDKNNFNNSVVKNENGKLKHVYHGTDAFGFDTFDKSFNDKNRAYKDSDKLVAFFSDRKENAQTYTKDKNKVYDVYLNIQKPLIVECDGKAWSDLNPESNEFGLTKTDDIINKAIESGKYDGVIFNNIQDRGPKYHGKLESYTANDYVVFDNSQIIQANKYNSNDTISFNDIQEQIKLRAKIDAQDVNLNFNAGGTLSKALSKSGFKFLNAGMLGMDKFVTHVGEGIKTPKGMGSLLLEFTAVGVGTALANQLLNEDDEDYDKLPYYYKNNYYMIKIEDGKYFRIPKGRVQALYNVLFEYASGIREEDTPKQYFDSIWSAFEMAVIPPALEQASPWAAYGQILANEDTFGNEIFSNEYDTTGEKAKKSFYHLLNSYFGRYGRMVKDITDGDGTTDIMNEFDYYKNTMKANRHYETVLDLVTYYQNKDNVKTLEDKVMKKYVDTMNYELRGINSEINDGKEAGLTTEEMKMLYFARDDLLQTILTNYQNFDSETDEDGNIWYYFDDHCFMYNPEKDRFTKKW